MAITHVSDGLYRPDLTHELSLYTQDSAGRYTVQSTQHVPCALIRWGVGRGEDAGSQRAELANQRQLHWDPSVTIPENDLAEIEVDGVRWHPLPGSFDALEGPTGEVFYRLCDVRRV